MDKNQYQLWLSKAISDRAMLLWYGTGISANVTISPEVLDFLHIRVLAHDYIRRIIENPSVTGSSIEMVRDIVDRWDMGYFLLPEEFCTEHDRNRVLSGLEHGVGSISDHDLDCLVSGVLIYGNTPWLTELTRASLAQETCMAPSEEYQYRCDEWGVWDSDVDDHLGSLGVLR